MRAQLGLLTIFGLAMSVAWADPIYSPQDRDQVMAYWNAPGRLDTHLPKESAKVGPWQVRLTVEGSTWLWNYNKLRKVTAPPTMNPLPQGEAQKAWDDWVLAKVNRDRWEAAQRAQKANAQIAGIDSPVVDKTIPATEPPIPGPMPSDLFQLCGNPPSFAESVVPMEHTVKFDDMELSFSDNVKLSNPRYAYYRFAHGVMSPGQKVKELPADKLNSLFRMAGVSESEARVMRAVSVLEGGFDSINTYDTGFVSIGFIQFACLKDGAGSLGSMLLDYKTHEPEKFAADFHRFGVDVLPDGHLDVLDPATGAEVSGVAAIDRLINDKRLIAVFQRAGLQSDSYCAAQIRCAKGMFLPTNDLVTFDCNGSPATIKVCDVIRSEAGLATLMDRKVNTGKIELLPVVLNKVAAAHNVSQARDLANYEAEIVSSLKYRKDYTADSTLSQPGQISAKNRATTPLADRGSGSRGHRTKKPR